jgi:hypothetical protein
MRAISQMSCQSEWGAMGVAITHDMVCADAFNGRTCGGDSGMYFYSTSLSLCLAPSFGQCCNVTQVGQTLFLDLISTATYNLGLQAFHRGAATLQSRPMCMLE